MQRLAQAEGRTAAEGIGDVLSVLSALQEDVTRLERLLAAQTDERVGLAALVEVAGVVNSSLELPEVLNHAMDQIILLTGAERAFLMLSDEDGGGMKFHAARNLDHETIAGSAFEISRSVVSQVAREGRPVLTTNAQLDPRFSNQASVVSYNLRAILCLPLRVRDRVIGVVYADNRMRAGVFSEQDLGLLTAFTDQAALAIENARLFGNAITAKALMDNVFASIASGVITTDVDGRITLVNRAAERLLGLSSDQSCGRMYSEVLAVLMPVLAPLMEQTQRHDQAVVGWETEAALPDRGPVTLSLSLSPLRNADQRRLGVALVLDDLTQRRRLEALQRYVSPAVVQRLLEGPDSLRLGGNRQEVTILFADLCGFTSFSERLNPEDIVNVLNEYLAIGAEAVLAEDGTLDKFMGDAVMAIFNAPLPQPDHTLRAVRAALRVQEAVREHHSKIAPADRLDYRIGIAVGEAVVGNVGTVRQLNYTAIGSSVNLARRVQEEASGGQVLLSHEACERVKDQVRVSPLPVVQAKGLSDPLRIYELHGLR